MKSAIVTGGSKGIGLACAQRLQQDGYSLVICARNGTELSDAADRLRAGGDVLEVTADVGDVENCARVVRACLDTYGQVDALVNNAGIYDAVPLLELTPEVWDRYFAVNLRGPLVIGIACAQAMRDGGAGGHIVNIASTNGLMSEPGFAHYNASKAALISLTETMAVEWAEYGIQVNAVAPGWILTPLSEPWVGNLSEEQLRKAFPCRRVGSSSEVAELVAFLCRDGTSYLTGTTIRVDGGMLAQHPAP
jgi:NAD(P)-dependent dehydrogenase (short-subunit alcohol dehydrogenase family)